MFHRPTSPPCFGLALLTWLLVLHAAAAAAAEKCDETVFSTLVLILGIVLVTVGVFLFSAAFILACCVSKVKQSHTAPTDSKKRLTVMCIDIDQALYFWMEEGDKMLYAIEKYNRMVRGLIVKYECLEWRSNECGLFVVVTQHPKHAARLARHLQHIMQQDSWDSCFDNFYIQTEVQRQQEDPDDVATSAFASEYKAIWNGPRVRVGIHSALPNVIMKSNGIGHNDYGSPASTTAYELCQLANGGQILVSEETYTEVVDPRGGDRLKEKLIFKNRREITFSSAPRVVVVRELVAMARREFPSTYLKGRPLYIQAKYRHKGAERDNWLRERGSPVIVPKSTRKSQAKDRRLTAPTLDAAAINASPEKTPRSFRSRRSLARSDSRASMSRPSSRASMSMASMNASPMSPTSMPSTRGRRRRQATATIASPSAAPVRPSTATPSSSAVS